MTRSVALIAFAVTMAIHMGLIDAVLKVLRIRGFRFALCPKCVTFWCSMAYCLFGKYDVLLSIATSFLFSYIAVWYDLLLSYADGLYEYYYERLDYEEADEDTDLHNKDNRGSASADNAVPEV